MSTSMEYQSKRERTSLYLAIGVVVAILMVLGLIFYRGAEATRDAQDKADQLISELEAAGARAPTRDQVTYVLGDDGGATCANPNEALSRSVLLALLTNGATGPGNRPVIADSRVFQGQLLIMEIYCPEELDDFKAFVDDLKTDTVAGD